MKLEDWERRWKNAEIGFHEGKPNALLLKFFPCMKMASGAHCLVPLCGKSADMEWLSSQGQRVTGIEYSPIAIEQFRQENPASQCTLVQADFFGMDTSLVSPADWIYDRAALVAILPSDRERYVARLRALLRPSGKIFLISFHYDAHEMEGPPFAADEGEISRLFSSHFQIERLYQEDIIHLEPRFREKGATSFIESAYLIGAR
jgi:thiopurine S-methyltransferase